MRRRVVLPAPLRPSTSRRSPRRSANASSDQMVPSPKVFVTPSICRASRPLCGGAGKRYRTVRAARIGVTASAAIRSTRLSRVFACRARLALEVAHSVGEAEEPTDLGVLTRGDASKSVLVLGPGGDVFRVRALVLAHFAVVEVKDFRDGLVEELQIVADHEKRAAERA